MTDTSSPVKSSPRTLLPSTPAVTPAKSGRPAPTSLRCTACRPTSGTTTPSGTTSRCGSPAATTISS